jgi:hypothetical protein
MQMGAQATAKRIGTGLAGEGIDKRIALAPRTATGIARRTLLGSVMLTVTALGTSQLIAGGLAMDNETTGQLVYIGCRTTRERNARGNGITVAKIRPDGLWQIVQSLDGIVNPAFLAFDHQRRFLFAVHGDGSEVSAFAIDTKTGTLSFLGKQGCQGKNPVHLAVDPTNKFLLVANHLTLDGFVSNVAVLPIGEDGRLGAVTDLVPLTGPIGPHRTALRQAAPDLLRFQGRVDRGAGQGARPRLHLPARCIWQAAAGGRADAIARRRRSAPSRFPSCFALCLCDRRVELDHRRSAS